MNIILSTIGTLQNQKESAHITTINLAKELQTLGHKVIIITQRIPHQPTEITIDNITIYRPYRIPFLSKLFSHPLAIHKLQKEKKINIDIIHSFSATPLFALNTFLSKLFTKNAKTIHTIKSYSRDKNGNRGNIFLRLVDKVTVPTKTHAQKINIKKEKSEVIYSPVNLNKFQPKDETKLKQKYHYQNKKIILYYGALWNNKGVDNLIKAIPLLIKERENNKDKHKDPQNLHFLFLPRYRNIEPQLKLIKELNIQNNIEFITNDVIIEDYVNLADVIVLPYKNLLGTEGNPSCLLEALACKTPVVTTKLPELEELFSNCTIMAIPNNPIDLAEKISQSLTQNNRKIIENGFQLVQSFDQKKIAKDFIKIYQELKSKNPNRSKLLDIQ